MNENGPKLRLGREMSELILHKNQTRNGMAGITDSCSSAHNFKAFNQAKLNAIAQG
jgi:hypothetical protein